MNETKCSLFPKVRGTQFPTWIEEGQSEGLAACVRTVNSTRWRRDSVASPAGVHPANTRTSDISAR